MLSKLFTSAKNLFVPPHSINNHEDESNQAIETVPGGMVTTRSQNASPEDLSGEDSITVEIPRSSRKRSRKSVEDEDSGASNKRVYSTPAKKSKVLPLREKDEGESIRSTRVVVEIPVSSLPVDVRDPIVISEEGSEEDSANENEYQEDAVTEKPESNKAAPSRVEISAPGSESGSGIKAMPSSSIPDVSKKATPTPSPKKSTKSSDPAKAKHKRFGSEEPELDPEFFSTAAEILDSEGESSSDDDAPEVVGAQDALKSAQSKARDAAKAVGKQESALKAKRQERDAVLKKQVEAATKKRKREEKKAPKKEQKKKPREEKATKKDDVSAPIPVISRSNLPDLLPDEYLQDDSDSEDAEDSEPEVVRTKPKKMKFAELVGKKPKDRRKGSTIYRVSDFRSKNLAPKSSLNAKATKESWLMGRAGKGSGAIKKVATGGFFKKK